MEEVIIYITEAITTFYNNVRNLFPPDLQVIVPDRFYIPLIDLAGVCGIENAAELLSLAGCHPRPALIKYSDCVIDHLYAGGD